jgi:hypothetical protein
MVVIIHPILQTRIAIHVTNVIPVKITLPLVIVIPVKIAIPLSIVPPASIVSRATIAIPLTIVPLASIVSRATIAIPLVIVPLATIALPLIIVILDGNQMAFGGISSLLMPLIYSRNGNFTSNFLKMNVIIIFLPYFTSLKVIKQCHAFKRSFLSFTGVV